MENNRIEYKRELSDSLEKEVVAFLNYREGGVIYIGVDDSTKKAVGLMNCDMVQLQIKDRLKNNILPSCFGLFDVIHEVLDGKDVIRVTVATGPEKPYYIRKNGMSERGCFIRVGSASEPMSTRMIEEVFSKRTRNSISNIKSPRQDLTFEQLKIYYQEAGFEVGEKLTSNLGLLMENNSYNFAAYLFADKNGNSVQVARYSGLDRVNLIESNEYGYCSLIKACKRVLDKLEIENRTVTKITAKERLNHRLWNQVALREATINALIHNDYTNEVVPKFEIFDDRIEITSAGSVPIGVAQEEFFQGYSTPRNTTLMRIFKDLDMVEYLGSGIPRILKAYSRAAYVFSSNFIRVVFPISKEALALEKNGGIPVQITAETTRKKTTRKKKLQERNYKKEMGLKIVDQVLALCRNNKAIKIAEIAKILDLTPDGVSFHLKNLQEKNFLTRIGGRKIGYWEVLELPNEGANLRKNRLKNTEETTRKKTTRKKKLQERNYKKEIGEKITNQIIQLCRKTPSVTIKKMSKELKVSEEEVLSVLKKLEDDKLLKYVSGKKGDYWKVALYPIDIKSKTKNLDNHIFESKAEYGAANDLNRKIEEKVVSYGRIAEEVINVLKINPYATGRDLSSAFSVSQSAIEKNIAKLQRAGRLKHHGPTKNGYWEVVEL